ncbi:MAG: hypothetical protein JST84_24310 [Acidobacteria bacterium]|nr:hypothetical protein [Acidobacteriota bacterium]
MENYWEKSGDDCFDLASELVTDIINLPDEEFLQLLKNKDVDLLAEAYDFRKNTQSTFEKLGLPLPMKLQNLPISFNLQDIEKEMRQLFGLDTGSFPTNSFDDGLLPQQDEPQQCPDTKNTRQP